MIRHPKRRIPVGISSCLLGQPVRYDGGHKRNSLLLDELGEFFEYLPFCPEVAIGLGTPRAPIRLTGTPSQPRAVVTLTEGVDVTAKLVDYAREVVKTCPRISGYVFKAGSPSCGVAGVQVYDGQCVLSETSSGVYARSVMQAWPSLPVEEEGRLRDPTIRDRFLERVYAYNRRQESDNQESIEQPV
jgi:uncharacterized protein YbbK (DUF523 family)